MRNLILLTILLLSGCMRHAVREETEDTVPSDKSEKQLLEERLGI